MRFIFNFPFLNVQRSIWCNILKISLITRFSKLEARLMCAHHLEGAGSI